MVTETATIRGLLIAGKQEQAAGGKTFDTVNPATGEVIARVAKAGREDVDRAVRAARQAFDEGPWPWTAASERGRVLLRTAALIRERAEELAQLEMRNGGKTISDARDEALGAASCFEYYACPLYTSPTPRDS